MLISATLASLLSCSSITPGMMRTAMSVDPLLMRAVVANESGFNPNATSRVGAAGLSQLMPATSRGLKICNPYSGAQSIVGGAVYLHSMLARYHGDLRLALASYNAGPGAVTRYGGVPPFRETQSYVERVMGSYARYLSADSVPKAAHVPSSDLADGAPSARGSSAAVRLATSVPGPAPRPHVRHLPPAIPSAFSFGMPNPTTLAVSVK